MRWLACLALVFALFAAPVARADSARTCESLTSLDLSGVADKPTHVASAAKTKFQGAEVCEVKGHVEPAVAFVVRLPLSGWDGRFLQAGCGGLCGHIPDEYAQTRGCAPFETGRMAVAATDMGHEGPGPDFGDDPQLREDFAYRGVHVTAQVAKALVAAFYGRKPDHSYFLGCSDGGREALMEAERYPEDFDGVTAGAPAMNFLIQNTFYHAWNALSNTGADGKPILAARDLVPLHRAALAACGAVDGVIADPLRCDFDPATASCKTGESENCLTPAQVAAARKIYEGPRDAEGFWLTPGGPLPGSELSWEGVFVPKAGSDFIFGRLIAGGAVAHLAFAPGEGRNLKLEDLTFNRATYERLLPQHKLYDATNPDISAFAGRGGKLILWHGAWDPHISPTNSISYAEAVEAKLGESAAGTFRFFLIPGLYHCEGGIGPVQTDVLSAMLDWVEQGKAPASLTLRDGQQTRPVYPYPTLAIYDGKGDPASASSYAPQAPKERFRVRTWMGSALFKTTP